PPLWQLKGVRVTHDSETKDVIYRDATLEMDGIPVLFSPYFSHPDSTVKRRQGFLTPSGGFSQELGTFARVPYYFDIAPNDDAVLMPIFSTTDILQLGGEWRHRFSHGNMLWSGSFTHTDLVDEYGVGQGSQWRGHLFGNTLFNLDRQWRAGTDVALTSDKSYLRRYNITSEDLLVNRGYVEGFRGRGYTVGNLYYFQDLRPGKQLTEPFVAPEIRFSALGDPGKTLGGRWSMDGGLLMTSRNRDVDPAYQGPDTRRLSFDAGWERQMVSSTGFLFNLSGLVRLDGYWANNVPDPTMPVGGTFSDITSVREFAQGDISLRYPLGRRGDGYQQIVEPISVLSVAPKQKSDSLLPNEDSLDVEFDETNLFAPNRFTGIDRLEGGTRAAYGLRHALIGDNGAQIEMVGGQVYRFRRDESFPDNSGLRDQLSDFVGRFDVAPAPWLNVSYGFRLSPNNVKFERQEAQISAGVPLFRPYVRYITVQQSEILSGVNTIPSTVEEATFGFSSKFAKYWSIFAAHTQSFQPTPGPRTTTAGFGYSDECFQFGLTAQRNNTDRQDIRSGTTVMFHFYLKNIGGIQTDSSNQESFTPSLTPSATTSGQNREPF
ncbi:MAG: LPS-assembly protein LptD, partial [Alphaproteobacteria bacterium]|nr:LPS-assembly protein LptD [Alphaproteobacteria bacterium]